MRRLLVLVSLLALALPAVAGAAERMFVGFQDDVSFRWAPDRTFALDRAREAGTTVIRATLYWYQVAATRPANPADPFDPAYVFDDVDQLVRDAQERGIEVMLTFWGTPAWANGNKGPNFLPANLGDANAFARAVASRYSGRIAGYPFVRFYTIGNEPNLEQFLAPQFDAKGKSVAPALYAKLYRAMYAGIKAASPTALVGVGETSPRGRDKPSPGVAQESHSPGHFAELLAKTRPKIKFDAWAQHPYPTAPNLSPTQRVRFPNVNLPQLPRFEQSLRQWFRRADVPIWITEYGHETKPEEPRGVSRDAQAAYVSKALSLARSNPDVRLFIWFILRDDFSSPLSWQSGLFDRSWAPKPALGAFTPLAAALDARNGVITVGAGTTPVVGVSALALKAHDTPGATVGINYTISDNGHFLGNAIANAPLGNDGWLSFRPDVSAAKGHRISLGITATDVNGITITRTIEIVGT